MEKKINLYDQAKTLNNDQLRILIREEDYKGQTAGLSQKYAPN